MIMDEMNISIEKVGGSAGNCDPVLPDGHTSELLEL